MNKYSIPKAIHYHLSIRTGKLSNAFNQLPLHIKRALVIGSALLAALLSIGIVVHAWHASVISPTGATKIPNSKWTLLTPLGELKGPYQDQIYSWQIAINAKGQFFIRDNVFNPSDSMPAKWRAISTDQLLQYQTSMRFIPFEKTTRNE